MEPDLDKKILEILKSIGVTSQANMDASEFDLDDYERRKVEGINNSAGFLEGYDCPECRNRGYFAYIDETGHRRNRICKCIAIRANMERLEKSGLKNLAERFTFDTWIADPGTWQEDARSKAREYAASPQGWFLAFGHSGAGKTHLCTAICLELMKKGYDVQYALWRDFSSKAKAALMDERSYTQIIEPLKDVRVLYLDDLFKVGKNQEPSVGDMNLAFEILNDRYNDLNKLTIISTERTIAEMMDLDEATASRIFERAKGNGVSFVGKENWRRRA